MKRRSASSFVYSSLGAIVSKPVDLYLDSEQLAALGGYAAHWAYLETEIAFTITALMTLVHDHQKIPFAFTDRIGDWKRLLPKIVKSPHALRHYDGLIHVVERAHNLRTRMLHGRALGDPLRKTRRICFEHNRHRHGNWTVNPIVVTPQFIRKASRIVGQTSQSLISLNRRYLPIQPYALPNRYPAPPRGGRMQTHQGRSDTSKQKNRPRSLGPGLRLERTDP